MNAVEYTKRYMNTTYANAQSIIQKCIEEVSQMLGVHASTVRELVDTIQYEVPEKVSMEGISLMKEQDYEYNVSLLADRKKDLTKSVTSVLIERSEMRQRASDQIDEFEQPESMLRLNKLSRIPVFARSQKEKDEIEALKPKACYNVNNACDQDDCSFTFVTLGRRTLCINLQDNLISGLFNGHVPAVDTIVRSVHGQEVVYPLDEEDSQRLLDQLGPVESWGDRGVLYPEIKKMVSDIQQMELDMLGRY